MGHSVTTALRLFIDRALSSDAAEKVLDSSEWDSESRRRVEQVRYLAESAG